MTCIEVYFPKDNFLNVNPFYLLNVSPMSSREAILEAVQSQRGLGTTTQRAEAKTTLVASSVRLNAELDWFWDCDEDTLATIRKSITQDTVIPSPDRLSPLSRLNAALYNFVISPKPHFFKLGHLILSIEDMVRAIDIASLTEMVNHARRLASFPGVTEQEVRSGLEKKAERIYQTVSEKLASYDTEQLAAIIEFLTHRYAEMPDNGAVSVLSVFFRYYREPVSKAKPVADEPRQKSTVVPEPKSGKNPIEEPSLAPTTPSAKDDDPPTEKCPYPTKNSSRASRMVIIALSAVICILLAVVIFLASSTSDLKTENATLSASVATLERTVAYDRRAVEGFETISDFLNSGYSDDYNANGRFFTSTNIVIVKKGKSIEFPVTNYTQGTLSVSHDLTRCTSVSVGEGRRSVYPVTIKGKNVGAEILTFMNTKTDDEFHVLVIVVD